MVAAIRLSDRARLSVGKLRTVLGVAFGRGRSAYLPESVPFQTVANCGEIVILFCGRLSVKPMNLRIGWH
jgi:hypothetical protein